MITFADLYDLSRSSFVPKLMKFSKIGAEILVPKFVYPSVLYDASTNRSAIVMLVTL